MKNLDYQPYVESQLDGFRRRDVVRVVFLRLSWLWSHLDELLWDDFRAAMEISVIRMHDRKPPSVVV